MKVLKNYLYNVAYQILNIILPLVTVPYVSRVLGPEGVGINSYTNSIIQYFILLGGMGTVIYGNRQIAYYRDDKKKVTKTFWEIEIMSVGTVVFSYSIFLLFLLTTKQYHIYYLEQSILIIAAAVDVSWLFMGMENFKVTVLRNMLVKIISVVATFWLVRDSHDVSIYILILTISQLLGNLTLWPYLRRHLCKIKISELKILPHLGKTIQFFIPQIAIQVYVVLNKTMLGIIDGPAYSGYYESADKLVRIILSIVTALGTVMLPHVAHAFYMGEKKKVINYLKVSFDVVSLIVFPITFGLASIALKLAPWFFGNKFAIVGPLIIIEAIAVIPIAWTNIVGQQYLLPTNNVRYYTISVIIGAFVNLVLNIPLILIWGVYGSMVATVISEFSVNYYQLRALGRDMNIRELFVNTKYYLISSSTMFIVVFLLNRVLVFNIYTLVMESILGVIIYMSMLKLLLPNKIKDLIAYLRK